MDIRLQISLYSGKRFVDLPPSPSYLFFFFFFFFCSAYFTVGSDLVKALYTSRSFSESNSTLIPWPARKYNPQLCQNLLRPPSSSRFRSLRKSHLARRSSLEPFFPPTYKMVFNLLSSFIDALYSTLCPISPCCSW